MKKIFLMMSLFLGALLLTGCGSKSGADGDKDHSELSAEETVEKFLDALEDKDVETVMECVDLSKNDEDDAEKECRRNGGYKSHTITEVQERGSRASITAEIKFKDGSRAELTYKLRKGDDGWIIVN